MNNKNDWHAEGNCVAHPDPDLWHYENSMFADEKELQALRSVEAISLCRTCPVKNQCLTQGLEDENLQDWGGWGTIWGGELLSDRYMMANKTTNGAIIRSEDRHRRTVKKKLAKLYG